VALLERDDGQPQVGQPQQLAGLEQEVGVRRPPVGPVAAGERLVEQGAVIDDRGDELRKQRAMEVVGDDERIEALFAERLGRAFEIRRARLDAGRPVHAGERRGVAIDGEHMAAAAGEEARVPAEAAGKVEDAPARTDEMREPGDPRRGRRCRVRGAVEARRHRCAPARPA